MKFKHFSKRTIPHGPLYGLSDEMVEKYEASRQWSIQRYLEDRDSVAYAAGQFLKALLRNDVAASGWCRDNNIDFVKAQSTGVNSSGGVLIPEIVADEVSLLIEQYGVARANANPWQMTSNSEMLPRTATMFTPSWIVENGTGTLQQASFDGVSVNAKKLGAFAKIPAELFSDASAKLGRCLMGGMAMAFAKAEDDATFLGDGTSSSGGIRGISPLLLDGGHNAGKVTAAVAHNSFGTIDANDIGAAIATLPLRALSAGAKIYISTTGYGASLARLGQSAGLTTALGPSGELMANWNGLPIVFTQSLPTSTSSQSGKMLLAVGNLEMATAFGIRRDLSFQWFDETYADVDQVLLRCTERIDIVNADLGDNSNAGAMVGLFAP